MYRVFLKGNLLLMIVNFATSLYIAHAIGPSGRGIVALSTVWPTMMLFWLNCNLPPSMSYFLPRLTPQQRRPFLGSAYLFAIVVGVTGTIVLEVIAPRILKNEAAPYLPLFRVLFLFVPVGALTELGTNILLGLQENGWWSYVRLVQPLSLALGVLVSLLAGHRLPLTPLAVIWLNQISGIIFAVVVLARVLRVSGIGKPGEGRLFWEAMQYSLKSHLTSVAGSLNQNLDQLLLGTFIGPRVLGQYTMAVNFTNLLAPFNTAAVVGVVPHLSTFPDEAERREAAVAQSRKSTVLLLAGTVLLVCAVPLIPLMYGQQFRGAMGMALLLLPGVFLRAIGGVLMRIVLAFNQPLKASLVEVVGLAVTAPALLILLPRMGGHGAAIASSLAYGAGWIMALALAARVVAQPARNLMFPLPWRELVRAALRRSQPRKPAPPPAVVGVGE